jgi:tetratricopeptide (TPR) repeat protein
MRNTNKHEDAGQPVRQKGANDFGRLSSIEHHQQIIIQSSLLPFCCSNNSTIMASSSSSSLEKSVAQLYLGGGCGDTSTLSKEVYSVSLLMENDAEDNFDRTKSKLAKKKRKDRQIWLGKPVVEQTSTEQGGGGGGSVAAALLLLEPSITLTDIATKVNHVWKDRILFVQTIRAPFQQSTGLYTLVQEESTTIIPLSLWNYLPLDGKDEFSGGSLDSELPKDSYLALVNPVMVPNRIWESKTKNTVMLRCDNPQCIRIFGSKGEWEHAKAEKSIMAPISLVPTDEGAPSAAQWKDQGNEAFVKKKNVTLAMRYYKQALATATSTQPPQTDIAISCLGNLAETCLKSGRSEEAEGYARRILSDYDPKHFKSQFRLARALIPQNKLEEAKEIIMQLRKDEPKNAASLQPILGECLQAIMETKGKYNLKKMLGEASLSPVLPFHANYVSPQVGLGVSVVRASDGETYRGVLATDDIAEGTLLTASQAFAFAYQQKNSSSNSSARKKHLYEVSQVHQAVTTLQKNPSEAAAFYRLEAGGEVPNATDLSTSDINLPKIRSILESNRFGVDVNSPASPFTLKSPSSQEDDDEDYVAVGLWLDVSMYNHSCTPNCTWAQIGNHMFVYACKDVKKGEELCIGYVHPALSYQDREERFAKWSGGKGFACSCEWCHWMRTSPTRYHQMNEEVKMAQMRMGSGEKFSSIDELITDSRRAVIGAAHKDVPLRFQHTVYNLSMMEALQAANAADRRAAMEAVKTATELGYAIRGGLRQETRVQDLCCLAAAHMSCNDDKQAQAALEELVKHQVILPSLTEFQNVVLMSSMQIWDPYQSEQFMKRWAIMIKKIWEQRSKQLM